jgi:hypothetical protein
MSEVRKWLEAIDLAQYADAFEANDLYIDLLGQVDDQVLKDIGVRARVTACAFATQSQSWARRLRTRAPTAR